LFQPHQLGAQPDLEQILRMSNRQYQAWLGETAMAWRGKTTLQRNALINLGNLRNPDAVPILVEALVDQRPLIRGMAAWALGEIGSAEAQRQLAKALEREEEVRGEMERALERSEKR
jgi:epoxyqueuosine reductase